MQVSCQDVWHTPACYGSVDPLTGSNCHRCGSRAEYVNTNRFNGEDLE